MLHAVALSCRHCASSRPRQISAIAFLASAPALRLIHVKAAQRTIGIRPGTALVGAEDHPMTTRDVLFPMLSYPVATATGSIESAVRLAAGLGAHIVGLTFELDIQSPVGLYADPVNVGGRLAAERRK